MSCSYMFCFFLAAKWDESNRSTSLPETWPSSALINRPCSSFPWTPKAHETGTDTFPSQGGFEDVDNHEDHF